MRVALWRDGGEPNHTHRNYRPMSPLPTGRRKRFTEASGIIADRLFRSRPIQL